MTIEALEESAPPERRRAAAEHCAACLQRFRGALPPVPPEQRDWVLAERRHQAEHEVDENRLLRFVRSRERALVFAGEWAETGARLARATFECGQLRAGMAAWLSLSHHLHSAGAARDVDRLVRASLVAPRLVPYHRAPEWEGAEVYHGRLDEVARVIRMRIIAPFISESLPA